MCALGAGLGGRGQHEATKQLERTACNALRARKCHCISPGLHEHIGAECHVWTKISPRVVHDNERSTERREAARPLRPLACVADFSTSF